MANIIYKYFTITEDKRKKIDSMKSVYAFWNESKSYI